MLYLQYVCKMNYLVELPLLTFLWSCFAFRLYVIESICYIFTCWPLLQFLSISECMWSSPVTTSTLLKLSWSYLALRMCVICVVCYESFCWLSYGPYTLLAGVWSNFFCLEFPCWHSRVLFLHSECGWFGLCAINPFTDHFLVFILSVVCMQNNIFAVSSLLTKLCLILRLYIIWPICYKFSLLISICLQAVCDLFVCFKKLLLTLGGSAFPLDSMWFSLFITDFFNDPHVVMVDFRKYVLQSTAQKSLFTLVIFIFLSDC